LWVNVGPQEVWSGGSATKTCNGRRLPSVLPDGHLRAELDLDDTQAAAVLTIVTEQDVEVQRALAATRPAMEAALSQGEERIRGALRPEQLPAFERFVRERRERFPGPPHRPGPRPRD
jgi:hypothetical protein